MLVHKWSKGRWMPVTWSCDRDFDVEFEKNKFLVRARFKNTDRPAVEVWDRSKDLLRSLPKAGHVGPHDEIVLPNDPNIKNAFDMFCEVLIVLGHVI